MQDYSILHYESFRMKSIFNYSVLAVLIPVSSKDKQNTHVYNTFMTLQHI